MHGELCKVELFTVSRSSRFEFIVEFVKTSLRQFRYLNYDRFAKQIENIFKIYTYLMIFKMRNVYQWNIMKTRDEFYHRGYIFLININTRFKWVVYR